MSGSGQILTPPEPKKNKTTIILLIVLIVVVLVVAGIIIYLLTRPDDDKAEQPSDGRGTVATEDNLDDILNATPHPDAYYTTSMSIDWHFKGKKSSDAYVENTTENHRTVYFDIVRTDTSEMIYSSPYIPVGKDLKGVTLDKELNPGTYDTILTYHLVDDDKKEVATLSVGLTIFVE